MVCFFADFWCILILRRLFYSLCVSNVYFFLYEFITAYKILPVLVCFRHRTTTSITVLQHWCHRRSIATGLAFSTHLYDGPAFSSPAFSTRVNWSRVFQSRVFHPPSCKMVSCFPVPRFQSSPIPPTRRRSFMPSSMTVTGLIRSTFAHQSYFIFRFYSLDFTSVLLCFYTLYF